MHFTKPKCKRFNPGTKDKLNDKNHICQIKPQNTIGYTRTAQTTPDQEPRPQTLAGNMIFCKTPKAKCSQCS